MPETALYRHFDANGTLLYVGISATPAYRLNQHIDREWFNDIRLVKVEMYPTREEALEAEINAIKTEAPRFNSRHVPQYQKHLIRLHTGDYKRLGKFYRKPGRIIRELVRLHIQRAEKE